MAANTLQHEQQTVLADYSVATNASSGASITLEWTCPDTWPPLRDWPTETVHRYGLEIILTALLMASLIHVSVIRVMVYTEDFKPYARRKRLPVASPEGDMEEGSGQGAGTKLEPSSGERVDQAEREKRRRLLEPKQVAVYSQHEGISQILGAMVMQTHLGTMGRDDCGTHWKLRTPTVVVLVVGFDLVFMLGYFEIDLVRRLPEALRADGERAHDGGPASEEAEGEHTAEKP